jgi:superfamily I DNA and/or RNA helicase
MTHSLQISHVNNFQNPVSFRIVKEETNNILRHFLRRLNKLSGNNRSLFLPRLHAEQLIDLQELSFLKGDKAFSIIDALISGKKKAICQIIDSRMESNNKTSQRLKKLARIDHFLFDEKGSNDLHVGWPFVEGMLMDGTLIRCPLLFFPVTLEQSSSDWILSLREDAGITFNKTFLLAYAHYNKVTLDEELFDFSFDDWEEDSTVFRTQLYQLLKQKIEINFNTDIFSDDLKSFLVYTKGGFEESHAVGMLKLQQEAVLGIFPQADSQLIPDYLTLMGEAKYESLEQIFEEKTNQAAPGKTIREEDVLTPLEIDAWQEEAIKKIKQGQSLVVQGPPGTGKSQLIANLVCDAVSSGKKVLIVCQKRVALDVVYERLGKLGLKNFIGLVHDFRNDRKEIFSTIASQIESVQDYKTQDRSVDVIQVERNFFHYSREIDTIVEELEEFRSALYTEEECGKSAKELYLTSDLQEDSINVKQEYQFFDFHKLPDFITTAKRYARYASRFEIDEHPWQHRVSFAHVPFSELKERTDTIQNLIEFKAHFEKAFQQLVGANFTMADGESLAAFITQLEELNSLIDSNNVYSYFTTMLLEKDEETSLLWLDNLRLLCMNCFKGGLEDSLPSDQLVKFQGALQQRMEARRRSIFRWIHWEFFSEDKFWLKRVLVANKLEYDRDGFFILERRLDNRLNLEHHLTALRKKSWLTQLPNSQSEEELLKWFEDQKKAVRAKLLFNAIRDLKNYVNPSRLDFVTFKSLLYNIIALVKELINKRPVWEKHLTSFQLRHLTEIDEFSDRLLSTLRSDFEDLILFDNLKVSLSLNEKSVVDKLYQKSGTWDEHAFEKIINNSFRLEWLNHLEAKYPVLRLVSSQQFAEKEKALLQSVVRKHSCSKELVKLRVRERIYNNIEYNRLNNPVTYRDLHHQVTKKRKVWPLRKVVSEFHQELFDLMPCWMASPESVSAIFPLKPMFDIVIFDEASQCFSEYGIPALMRGKQVLIAGDSQQLQPSDLYEVRWNEEGDLPDLEVTSLLALAERYFPTVYLQGHYRSHSPELIHFSNQFFYKGKLRMLPSYDTILHQTPAIEYLKVNGWWENQTNEMEAVRVVDKVVEYLETDAPKELGVITFNAPQQQLILDKLESRLIELKKPWPSTLFVKNIENVQGDEKDIIIFSIGYAPDKQGKMHHQFGSLGVAGGENRLNVAISRAREKVIIVASIHPEQLKVEEAKNDGPRLLQKYLQFAYEIANGITQQEIGPSKLFQSTWYMTPRLFNNEVVPSSLPIADALVTKDRIPMSILLTDDEAYKEALSAKSLHAYDSILLEKRKWRFSRLFSRNFWINREDALFNLKKMGNPAA